MRKVVFAFVMGCSSFCMVGTLGMSTSPSSSYNREYDRLEALYVNLATSKKQLEISYEQEEEELKTTRKELEELKNEKESLEEYHELMMEEYANIFQKNERLEEENKALKIANKKLESKIRIMETKAAAMNEGVDCAPHNSDKFLSEQVLAAVGKGKVAEEKLELEEDDKELQEKLEKNSVEEIEDKITEQGEIIRVLNDSHQQITEASMTEKDEESKMTNNSLSDSGEDVSLISEMDSRNGEASRFLVENNNLASELARTEEKVAAKELGNPKDLNNLRANSVLHMTEELSDAGFKGEKSSTIDISEKTSPNPSKIKFEKEKIFTPERIFPDRIFSVKEYQKSSAESPTSLSAKSNFGFDGVKHSFDDPREKLEKALREIQELKSALQKALVDKSEAENGNLRLKRTNDSLIRQLSEKTREIKKFKSDISEISKDVAEIFSQLNCGSGSRRVHITGQARNLTKLSFIRNKLAKINSIVRKSNALPAKRGWNKTPSFKNQTKKMQNERKKEKKERRP